MSKICLNNAVWDKYYKGDSLNDAISDVFANEIQDRVKENPKFADLKPLQMVMYDAGIKKTGYLGDMMNMKVNNSAYTSVTPDPNLDINQWLFPAWVETTLREDLYGTDYLPYLVNTRIGIDGNTVQSPTLNLLSDTNKKALYKARIAEGADIPTGKITIGAQAITLWKRGRAIELTYEAARRMRIELFQRQMRAIASDLAHQEIEFAADVLVNGDGNTDSAATQLGTTSKANTIEANDIIDALIEYSFKNHFNADTMVVPKKYLKEIAGMMFDSQLRPGASMNLSFNIPQISNNNLTVIGVEDMKVKTKEAFVLLNRDLTLVRYEENGSNIQEMDNFIRNQTRLMTLTENSGYAIGTAGSNMYVEVKSA